MVILSMVFVLAVLIWMADYADRHKARWARWIVRLAVWAMALVFFVLGGGALFAVYTDPESTFVSSVGAAWGGFVLAVVTTGAVVALSFVGPRRRVARIFPPYRPDTAVVSAVSMPKQSAPLFPQEGTPLFPQQLNYYTDRTVKASGAAAPDVVTAVDVPDPSVRGFNPESEVHALALLFTLLALGGQFINFALGGGLAGVAADFEGGIRITDLLLNSLPMMVLPFVGVGLGTRRSWRQTLQRLGLARLRWENVRVALAAAFGLLVWLVVVGLLWQIVVPKDLYEEQTQATDALAENVLTLSVAFTLSATAAVGEEITFRGALQPVFGFWPTAIYFTLSHSQYTLTPAWLLILGVAVVLGWLRRRYNTTTAMLTHFLYNFAQLLVALSAPALF